MSSVGLIARILHTYPWQIERFASLPDHQRLEFASQHLLYETIELEGMDLDRWFREPRLYAVLFMLAQLPERNSAHPWSVLRAKAPQLLEHIQRGTGAGGLPVLDGVERYGMRMLENKRDAPAALVFEILATTARTLVQRYEESLADYERRLLANPDDDAALRHYRSDVQAHARDWREKWLRFEFWRASALHNLAMQNPDEKPQASAAMQGFLDLHQKIYTDGSSMFYKEVAAITKLLKEEY